VTTVVPLSAPLAGKTLGGTYRIVERIDEGGMGTVYTAEHVRLSRLVAVKVMARHLKADPAALVRFRREAEIISQIHHPHVVQILDFDTTDEGQPYLVMEMLKGLSLEKTLSQSSRLPLAGALRVAIQCAWALSAAHAAGVVHRDLKPANIFLVDAGDPYFVKLLDFGISKRGGDPTRGRHLTGEFDILGTPDYMSPEQAIGRTAQVDHRGDQYSLAVILFEMLTGRVPFSAPDVMSLLQRVISEPAPLASSINPLIPPSIDRVLDRALSKAPEERFDTVDQFAAALEDIQLDHPVRVSLLPRRDPTPVRNAVQSVGPPSLSLPESEPPEREFRKRTSWRAQNPVQAVRELVDRARQELGIDNLEVALSCAESAIEVAQEMSDYPDASQIVRQNARLFTRIFERKLGVLTRPVKVLVERGPTSELRPEQAFILSRFDGGLTIEEVIDLSPLSRELTLAHIVGLLRAGHIELRS
jgi:eukaryotic-like serine/threonine-protein kinase